MSTRRGWSSTAPPTTSPSSASGADSLPPEVEGVVALVPARSGSRGIPDKNLAELCGFPLLAYSVRAGLMAESVDRVIVTTDSEDIARRARQYGAEAPFLRPAELAGDDSLDIDYVRHALGWLTEHESTEPRLLIQLRPTT